jgi:tyrosine-protein kinase Etk/Wzc
MTHNGSVAHTPGTQTTLRDVWSSIRRSRWLVLGITVTVVALVGVFTALATPTYESEATLRITSKESGSGMLGDLPQFAGLGLPGRGQEEIDTEMGVLRSRRIAEAVVDSLGLVVDLLEPSRSRSSVLSVLRVERNAPEGEYTLRLGSSGGYTVQVENQREPVALPASVSIGQPFVIGNLVLALAPALDRNPPDEMRFVVQPFQSAVQNLRDNLLVERQAGRSKLVEISFRHRDPQLAATVVNAVAASFVGYKRETSKTESRSMVEFLREQTGTYGRQLAESEARMRGFREQRRVVNPGEEAIQQVRQAATLRAEREATQIERQSLAQLLAQANQGARSATSDSPCRQLATFPSFITNPAVQAILGRLTSLEDERSALLLRFTPENEQVRRIGQRIQELEIQLYRLAVDYLRSLDNKIAAANAALARSGRELAEVPARENEFGRMARDQGLLHETYMLLQKRLKEAEIQKPPILAMSLWLTRV